MKTLIKQWIFTVLWQEHWHSSQGVFYRKKLTDHLHIDRFSAWIRSRYYLHTPSLLATLHIIRHDVVAGNDVERMPALLNVDDLLFWEYRPDVVVLFADFRDCNEAVILQVTFILVNAQRATSVKSLYKSSIDLPVQFSTLINNFSERV